MAGEQDINGQGDDLGELIGWLEDERTKDLVDLINRAAKGEPVDEAADRYKARYRHSGSVDKLSDMFDSLQQQHDSNTTIRLCAIYRQLEQCHGEITKLRDEFLELQEHSAESCAAETDSIRQLAGMLGKIDDIARTFRERVLSSTNPEPEAYEGRLRIIGL